MANDADRMRVLRDDEGDALWFLGSLMVTKADAQLSEGRLAFFDQTAPPHFGPPRHIHRDDDEAWYILDGEVTFLVGNERIKAGKGAFAFLPKGVEHTFLCGPAGARMLTLTTPASFGDFVQALSQPASTRTLPPLSGPPSPQDQRRLVEAAARYGIDITGPPPTAERSS